MLSSIHRFVLLSANGLWLGNGAAFVKKQRQCERCHLNDKVLFQKLLNNGFYFLTFTSTKSARTTTKGIPGFLERYIMIQRVLHQSQYESHEHTSEILKRRHVCKNPNGQLKSEWHPLKELDLKKDKLQQLNLTSEAECFCK